MAKRNIDIALIRTFILVVDLGGQYKAAEAVHRSQPAISIQLTQLECLLHLSLFKREGKGNVLTEDGKEVYRLGKALLEINDLLISECKILSQAKCLAG